jgi:hypothetical protein
MKSWLLVRRILTYLMILGFIVALVAISNPDNIAYPEYEHAHLRMSFSHNGVEENFGDPKYQQGYSKDSCDSGLPKEPLHFHDAKNHFVHVHWQGLTGGQVLKYLGLNKIDWFDSYLGIKARKEKEINLSLIPIHGKNLPTLKNDEKLWIYSGNPEKFELKSTDDFLYKDLETFFNKKSEVRESIEKDKKLNFLELNAVAHGSINDNDEESSKLNSNKITNTPEELKKINNLLGDVVIFAQKDKPTDEQVKDKFTKFEPLSDSSCGG